jgi:hypothetical protein
VPQYRWLCYEQKTLSERQKLISPKSYTWCRPRLQIFFTSHCLSTAMEWMDHTCRCRPAKDECFTASPTRRHQTRDLFEVPDCSPAAKPSDPDRRRRARSVAGGKVSATYPVCSVSYRFTKSIHDWQRRSLLHGLVCKKPKATNAENKAHVPPYNTSSACTHSATAPPLLVPPRQAK